MEIHQIPIVKVEQRGGGRFITNEETNYINSITRLLILTHKGFLTNSVNEIQPIYRLPPI